MDDIHDSKIFTDFKNKYSLIGDEVISKTLYQYTHSATIINLLSSNCLWGTNYKNLNDPTELTHGFSFFLPAIYDFLSKICDIDLGEFQQKFENEMDNLPLKVFVSSFTENKDLLSQWRGYGDFGQGMSIGLNPKEVKLDEDQTSFWVKVIYDDNQKISIIKTIFQDLENLFKSKITMVKGYPDAEVIRAILLSLIQVTIVNSIRFKDKSWREECEWRLVKLHFGKKTTPVKVRSRDHHLIEYFEFPFVNDVLSALSEIVIGPRSNLKNQKTALETLMQKRIPKITYSSIPWI